MAYPSCVWITPTYGRPKCLENLVECFLKQDYPVNRRRLVVIDDLGTIQEIQHGAPDRISLLRRNIRFPSLPEKFNYGWKSISADFYIIAEDDDIQLPWCTSSHAQALEHHLWSHPSHVWSDYGEKLHTEPVGGRFHGSLAIRRTALEQIGGWPVTKRADFDQQLISLLQRSFGDAGDPCQFGPTIPQTLRYLFPEVNINVVRGDLGMSPYLFRWHLQPGQTHGQSTMRSPDDESWYDRYSPSDSTGPHTIIPAFDSKTKEYWDLLTQQN